MLTFLRRPRYSVQSILPLLLWCIIGTRVYYYIMDSIYTRCYFNVRSKADISQLNLPHADRKPYSPPTFGDVFRILKRKHTPS